MPDYKMKAREYKEGHLYWIVLNGQLKKGQKIIHVMVFAGSYIKDKKEHYKWIMLGREKGIVLTDDMFDSDGEILYTGEKWK